MNKPFFIRLYGSALRSMPSHVCQRDRAEMVDAFAEMWRSAKGPQERRRWIMAVVLSFPRLLLAEWWDAMSDTYYVAPFGSAHPVRFGATRTRTPVSSIPVRLRPLALALVVCALASRAASASADALFLSSLVHLATVFAALSFFMIVACSNATNLLSPHTANRCPTLPSI
jgi:hypothetical protein